MASENFYKKEPTVLLKPVATPSGYLKSPTDLMKSKPFWAVTEAITPDEAQRKKKTLIFAHHAYSRFDSYAQADLMNKLRELQESGFRILIQWPDGLKEWDGIDLPKDYSLDFKKFNKQAINQMAWSIFQVAPSETFLLDYAGCYELDYYNNVVFYSHHFIDKYDELAELILTAEEKPYVLCFQEPQEAASEFIKIISAKRASFPFSKCTVFHIENSTITASELSFVFDNFKNLTILSLKKCKDISQALEKLAPGQCKELTSIDLSEADITPEAFLALIKAAPNLREINLAKCPCKIADLFRLFETEQLAHLQKIKLDYVTLDSFDLLSLLKRAPSLSRLGLDDATITDDLADLKLENPTKLRNFDLLRTKISSSGIANLWKTAPLLSELNIEYVNIEDYAGEYFSQFPENFFVNVHSVDFNQENMSGKEKAELLKRTPNLDSLAIIGSRFPIDSRHISSVCLQGLKSVTFHHAKSTAKDLDLLSKIAPSLNILVFHGITSGAFELLSPMQLKTVKSITIYHSSKSDDIPTHRELTKLFAAAPLLELLSLPGTEEASRALEDLASNQLLHLKAIVVAPQLITLKALQCLLAAAPNLKKIALDSDMKDLLSADVKLALKNIVVSYFEDSVKKLKSGKGFGLGMGDDDAEAKQDQYSQLDDRFFDTKFRDQTLSFTEYFPGSGKDPSEYRLIPWYPDLNSLKGPPKKFIPHDLKEKILSDFIPDEKSFTCHKGIRPTQYSEGDTIVLPSLDASEKVFNIKIIDSLGRVFVPKKIMYSESTQFHAVKLPCSGEYTIHYQVAIPNKVKAALPVNVQELVAKYSSYGQSDESPQQKFKTTREFAKYMQEHKPAVGSCRHRAIAAYDELVKEYDKNVRIMLNDIHAYMELKIGNDWHALDLGGYPGRKHKLPMKAKSLPMFLTEKKEEKVFTPPPIPFEMKEIDLDALLSRTFKKPALVLAESDISLQDFYRNLHEQYPADNIFIAHDPEDLSLNGPGMTEEGKVLLNYTTLSQWLKKLDKKSGVICVDIREFNEKELAQLNDLLDGRIENEALPKNIRIVLVDHPQRGYYGPDFRRRVPNKVACVQPEKKSLLEDMPKTLKNCIEIDLYQSPYWQNIVLGRWQMQPSTKESIAFQWQKSELLNLLVPPAQREEKRKFSLFSTKPAGKAIVFKNPPLQDPKFLAFMAEIQSLQKIAWADQATLITPDTCFYQTSGYDWDLLKGKVSLHALTGEEKEQPYVLSDANILDFINDPAYRFSSKSNFLTVEKGYLTEHQKTGIDILCAPGLTKGTLARFLAEAKKRDMPVRFLTPNLAEFPKNSPLAEIFKPIAGWEAKQDQTKLNTEYKVTTDIPYAVQQYLISSEKKITAIDASALDASELIRQPILDRDLKDQLIRNGTLTMKSHLAGIAEKLLDGETVLLYGRIAPDLYEAIATLALGYIEGKRYPGKLILVTPPENASLVEGVTFFSEEMIDGPSPEDTFKLFQKIYPDAEKVETDSQEEKKTKFLELEKSYIKSKLAKIRTPLVDVKEEKTPDDEELSRRFEQRRLKDTQNALRFNPWVMIEGPTGIGKTHFLQEILPKAETIVPTLTQWLERKPVKEGQHLIYVVDEASFMSQLSGEGENFLERFKGLKNTPPSFYWQGKYYPLTPEHKVVFAFNPASYGAGRSTQGILNEHTVPVSFERLPYFYIRARVIAPLLKEALPEEFSANLNWIADPIYQVFKWFQPNQSHRLNLPEDLLSPREIKMMINIIVSQIKAKGIKDKELIDLASEVAYQLGKQALSNQPKAIQDLFDRDCKPSKASILNTALPKHYLRDQQEAYSCFQTMLLARSALQARHKETKEQSSTDLGLGGVVIEGVAGIGKTHFIEQLIEELKERKEVVYRISPSTPYAEKEAILRKAFEEGAIVVGEELNASLWPNKMLNNFLMGLDEKGIPAKKPGFMLFATQNPSYFAGRSEEDPALRRRMIKLMVDWPVYQAPKLEVKATATNINQPVKIIASAILVNQLNMLNKSKMAISTQLALEERSIIATLAAAHSRRNLQFSDIVKAYLDAYKFTRERSKLGTKMSPIAKPMLDCLVQSFPEIENKMNSSLGDGIKNTDSNRLLAWIGNQDFAQFGEPIKNELLQRLVMTMQDCNHFPKMTAYWQSYKKGSEDRAQIQNLIKLICRMGKPGFTLISQLFWGNQNPPKKVSEEQIKEYLDNKEKFLLLQKNIDSYFTSKEEKRQGLR